jgi:TonB family protein
MIAYYFALVTAMTGDAANIHKSVSYFERIDTPVILFPPGKGSTPVPTGNPGLWVTTNDYPAFALKEEREGLVGFSLTVGRDGRVISCSITSSSGSPDLDSTACTLITLRARFAPAKDARGKPQIGQYANRVRWQIPSKGQNVARNLPIPKQGQASFSFTVDENGKPSDCTMSGSPETQGAKTPCDAGVLFQPYYNNRGERVRVRVETSSSVRVTEEGDAAPKSE